MAIFQKAIMSFILVAGKKGITAPIYWMWAHLWYLIELQARTSGTGCAQIIKITGRPSQDKGTQGAFFLSSLLVEFLKLNRTQAQQVTDLLTGHCHVKGIFDGPICGRCCMETETASHILYECVALAKLRFYCLGKHFMKCSGKMCGARVALCAHLSYTYTHAHSVLLVVFIIHFCKRSDVYTTLRFLFR
jgi:hypothetical protein